MLAERPKGMFMEPRELVLALKRAGMTQEAIAAASGIRQASVSKIERGAAKDVMSRNYRALLSIYEQCLRDGRLDPSRQRNGEPVEAKAA